MMNASAPRVGAFVMMGPTSPDGGRSIPFARAVAVVDLPARRVSARASSSAWMPVWLVRGLAAGATAAAAVCGLLLGIGRRAGTAWRPINAAAHGVLGAQADGVWSWHGTVTPVGGGVVLLMSLVAGIVAARIAPSFRTLHVMAAAGGVALMGYLLHLHVVARAPGGLADLLSVGELRGLYLLLAVALVAGMRFAFSTGAAAFER